MPDKVKNKGGRPPLFKTDEELQSAINKYFNEGIKKRTFVIGSGATQREIQAETAYPNSRSVQQALLKVWNECEQERVKNCSIPNVVGQSEQLVCSCGSIKVQTTGGLQCPNNRCSSAN